MEVDERAPGKAGGTCMAAPTSTWHPYHHPEATYSYSMADQTPGSPHSIHTDTDAAMEMEGLGMSSGRSETCRVMPQAEPPEKQTRMLSAPDLVSSITKGMTAAAMEILERFACPPPVDDAADAAIRECFQQRRAAASQFTPAGAEASGWISAFDWLGHRAQTPQKEDQWVPRPKMTPQKVERGHQASRTAGQEPPRSTSQKRCSQSRPRDEVDSKKGRMEGDERSSKVQVGIDWSNMGIQKPVPKPDPHHPSFKPDLAGAGSNQQPRVKSSVVSKGSLKQSSSHSAPPGSQEPSERQSRKAGSKTSGLTDPEKLELKEKSYHWIVAGIHHLDPKGYVEEIHSFWHFHRNSKSFTLEIIVIADWGRKCADVGLHYPIPAFPNYLFNEFARSRQGGGQVPTKPDYLTKSGGDVWAKCMEAWIWMVSILQFWTDKASIADGELFGGQMHLVSRLAKYVMNTINPILPPGCKVSWDHIITRTPWMRKRLFNSTSEEERQMRCQPIPVAGISSDLEVAMEKCYNEHIMDTAAQEKKKALQEKPGTKPSPSSKPSGLKNMGRRETIKIHLKKMAPGQDWTHIPPKDKCPDVGKCYDPPPMPGWYGSGPGQWFPDRSKPSRPFTTNRWTSRSRRGCDYCPWLSGRCAGGPGDCTGRSAHPSMLGRYGCGNGGCKCTSGFWTRVRPFWLWR